MEISTINVYNTHDMNAERQRLQIEDTARIYRERETVRERLRAGLPLVCTETSVPLASEENVRLVESAIENPEQENQRTSNEEL